MRILVTGGAGFIGSHVVDRYLRGGHEVGVLDNLSSGFRHNLNPKAVFFPADVAREADVERVFGEFQPEIVNHHAAQIDVRRSVLDPVFDARVNVLGSLYLLQAAARHGVRKMLYASTGGALYGAVPRLPADEDQPIVPESPYGVSKHAAEQYLRLYRRLEGIDYTVLRYPNVFGPRQNPHGEAGVNAIFIALLCEGKTPVIYGDGEQVRDYLYVDDVAEANHLALERAGGEILNLGWGRPISVNQVYRTLCDILGHHGTARYAARRPGEVERITLDATRARERLGWRPTVPFEEGLTRTLAWYREAGARLTGAG
jgi:UDP-glucose 4-epimerase